MPSRGEIYEFNFGDRRGAAQRGARPALVVQNDLGNQYAPTTIVAAMSTGAIEDYDVRVPVRPKESGLRERSVVMLDQLFTVDQSLLRRRIGQLSTDAMAEVDQALGVSLGLVH